MVRETERPSNENASPSKKKPTRVIRWVLISAGTICIGLGILGIILPILPTTPFLLLAAACYARSSDRFYHLLLSNKLFGKCINDYREKRGITLKVKVISILFIPPLSRNHLVFINISFNI